MKQLLSDSRANLPATDTSRVVYRHRPLCPTSTDGLCTPTHPQAPRAQGTHFEMEAGHDGQLLHGELLCGLLVAMATATLDLGTAS